MTAIHPKTFSPTLELKNLKTSGEYSCRYKNAEAFWFLRVRSEYKEEEHVIEKIQLKRIFMAMNSLFL